MAFNIAEQYFAVLITGASSGIGAAYAEHLARAGCDLVLVARRAERLEALADELRAAYGRRIEVIPADLTAVAAGAALAAAVAERGIEVDLLVNNAGFASVGSFHSLDAVHEHREILLNAAAVVDLCHAFVPGMLERGRGGIINVASLAGFQPLPYMSVYAATKAFVRSFSQGLWGEVHGQGLRVLCVCPGPVDTPFFEATGKSGLRKTVPRGMMASADDVVADSLKALQRGSTVLVPGIGNRLAAVGSWLMPRNLLTRITAQVMRR